MLTRASTCDRRVSADRITNVQVCQFAAMLAPPRMEPSREPSAQEPYTDGRSISGKAFVVVFLAISVLLAGIVTVMRTNVRPKYQAAVASSSAKAIEIDAAKAAASGRAPCERGRR